MPLCHLHRPEEPDLQVHPNLNPWNPVKPVRLLCRRESGTLLVTTVTKVYPQRIFFQKKAPIHGFNNRHHA